MTPSDTARLLVSEPPATILDTQVVHLSAPGPHGRFVVLPRHVDTVIPLGPGLTTFLTPSGGGDAGGVTVERFLAHAQGVLVKVGREIRVVFEHVVVCDHVEEAEDAVRARFRERTRRERLAASTLARLEAEIARHLASAGD